MSEYSVSLGPAFGERELALGDKHRYRALGLTVETELAFRTKLLPSAEAPDLRFRITHGSQPPRWPVSADAVFESTYQNEAGTPLFSIHPGDDGQLLRFPEIADYFLTADLVHGHLMDPDYGYMMEAHFLGMVLALWLELAGILTLHASAVSVGNRAVAFLGTNKAGKSSLAVAMMQRGCPLLSDDIVGLVTGDSGIHARPGFPSMRMWPDLAQHANGAGWEQLPLVHPGLDKRRVDVGPGGLGRFIDEVQPLACVYIPKRRDVRDDDLDVWIEPVSRAKAVFELLREAFFPWLAQDGEFGADRLQILGELVERVPVRRLVYPEGFQHLPRIAERVLSDLNER